MTAARPLPNRLIVLRQVEGSRWCVVHHEVHDGKRRFAGRIATAREYAPACRVALAEAKRSKLPLGIEATGEWLRPFRSHDMPQGTGI